MAEDKPFAPSESRIRKARQDGDRPQLSEVLGISAFVAGWWALEQSAPRCFLTIAALMRYAPSTIVHALHTDTAMPVLWNSAVANIALSVIMVLSASALATVAIAVLFGNLGWKMPSFQLSRLAPAQNLKRVFSLDTLTAAVRSFCMTLLVLAIIIAGIWTTMQAMLGSIALERTVALALESVQHNIHVLIVTGCSFALLLIRDKV